jgi:hypothetical protein
VTKPRLESQTHNYPRKRVNSTTELSLIRWLHGSSVGKEQKAKRQLLELVRNGWFWFEKFRSANGPKTIAYCIGKEAGRHGKAP